jgi:16S rRNA (uracil1498-N3)-methyltransferase
VRLNQAREDKRLGHWQQIAIHAAEQCGRSSVPRVHPVTPIEHWIANQPASSLRLVLHHRDSERLSSFTPAPGRISILIGPEGGLSEAEINQARSAGFIATTLGPRIFRTETAPAAALSVLQWLWGDFPHPSPGTPAPGTDL